MNLSLLCKWWWKFEKETGLWQKIVSHKYMRGRTIYSVKHKQTDSPCWSDLLKIKHIYLQGRKIKVRNGKSALFWQDSWLYDSPLCILFPDLFKLCNQKEISVYQGVQETSAVTFCRWLSDELASSWAKIIQDLEHVQLTDLPDIVLWKLDKKNAFTVKSTYNALTSNENGNSFKNIWKGKVPPKIKIFLWLVANGAILTKDNMKKRQWPGEPTCYFCEQDETVNHLLFECSVAKSVWAIVATSVGASNIPRSFSQCWTWCECWIPNGKQYYMTGVAAICWSIWKMRNQVCFEGKKFLNPIGIICHAGALMKFWAGLLKSDDKDVWCKGVDMMIDIATKLLAEKEEEARAKALEGTSKKTDQ
jgi:hypothetical protein